MINPRSIAASPVSTRPPCRAAGAEDGAAGAAAQQNAPGPLPRASGWRSSLRLGASSLQCPCGLAAERRATAAVRLLENASPELGSPPSNHRPSWAEETESAPVEPSSAAEICSWAPGQAKHAASWGGSPALAPSAASPRRRRRHRSSSATGPATASPSRRPGSPSAVRWQRTAAEQRHSLRLRNAQSEAAPAAAATVCVGHCEEVRSCAPGGLSLRAVEHPHTLRHASPPAGARPPAAGRSGRSRWSPAACRQRYRPGRSRSRILGGYGPAERTQERDGIFAAMPS
mmetsp:Transcript_127967/g.409989  ORF Transcript_127967/g.409989 Transcript_127967/m.409989 type:complete len:287 (+) Transcript_127967:513-1373(+)